jgi:oligoendopeptidase F
METPLAGLNALSVRADGLSAEHSNFASALEAALFAEQVPTAVYGNFISTVNEHLLSLHQYCELRAKLLGLSDGVHEYDMSVPLVRRPQTLMNFDEAIEIVLTSLRPLGPNYVDQLHEGLNSRSVDRYATAGKQAGAYCWSSYRSNPYISTDFQQRLTLSDVYTLTHELGHAGHNLYAR